MLHDANSGTRWLLALESSSLRGGAALLHGGIPADAILMEAGLRHGRELLPAAATLLERAGIAAADLWAVAVSAGPGSYTGTRVGVMAAKALAFGTGCRLAAVSSLAAMSLTTVFEGAAAPGDAVMVLQDARRDEVYAGVYRLFESHTEAIVPDTALAPEEARDLMTQTRATEPRLRLAGSGFTTYSDLFRSAGADETLPGLINPTAVGLLGWRQLLQEQSADPLILQPSYLRRDEGADWRRDHLITQS